MNSTPAASRVRRSASSLTAVSEVPSSATSARLIVLTPTDEFRARSSALHRSRALAALICALESERCFMVDFCAQMGYLTPHGVIVALIRSIEISVGEPRMKSGMWKTPEASSRRSYVGGSDARIIMGPDEPALLRLWREKRG